LEFRYCCRLSFVIIICMEVNSKTRKQLAIVVLTVIGLSLLFRLADMTLSGVNWGGEDYLAAGALLGGSGLCFVLASRNISDPQAKRRFALRILIILALGWVLLATEFDGFSF